MKLTVDTYPAEEFEGTVSQIRREPIVTQNVVTYATIIDAPNPEFRLKPIMTATVTVEVARRENVVRIPNAALRCRPPSAMFETLGQAAPPELSGLAQANGMGAGGSGGFGWTEARHPERRQRMMERLQQMSPEERKKFLARMPARRARDAVGGPVGSGRAGNCPASNAAVTFRAPRVLRRRRCRSLPLRTLRRPTPWATWR